MKDILFEWDKENKIATCKIKVDNYFTAIGIAKCHPEDEDFANEFVGSKIAETRALIKGLCYLKDRTKEDLSSLKFVYNSMKQSYRFNKDSFEAKTLFKNILNTENDIKYLTEEIETLRKDLINFISEKDNFYKKMRIMRKRSSNNND